MRVIIKNEFVPINALVVLLIAFTLWFPTNPIRSLLVLPFVFIFPGYCLTAMLAPAKGDLKIFVRIVISLGLSIFVTPLIGFLLNYTPWGMSTVSLLLSHAALIFFLSAVAWQRRKKLPLDRRLIIDFEIPVARWWRVNNLDRALNAILLISLIVGISSLAYVTMNPIIGEKYTEFYILGSAGKAADYPKEIIVGSEAKVTVGIINREGTDVNYHVTIRIGSQEVDSSWSVTLHDGEKIEHEMSFTPQAVGENQKVEFLLYTNNNSIPYRNVYYWITVRNG
jgi:uncharacterized membrane protein